MKDGILTYSGGSSSSTPSTFSPEGSFGSPEISVQHSPEVAPERAARTSVEESLSYEWYGYPPPTTGTIIPNRVFVGGISPQTTQEDLAKTFQKYGVVWNTRVIVDRAGASKGYGFVTFESEMEAKTLCNGVANNILDPVILHQRRLNIAPAVRKSGPISGFCSFNPSCTPVACSFQGNASQYYYQALPFQLQGLMYYSQDVGYFAPIPMPQHSYYADHQPIPYFAPRTHSVLPLPQPPLSPPQISLANPSIYQIQVPSPIEPLPSNMWQHSPPPCPPCPLFDSMDAPPYFNRFMFAGPTD